MSNGRSIQNSSLHPGCTDRPCRHVPSHTFVEDGDEGVGEVVELALTTTDLVPDY